MKTREPGAALAAIAPTALTAVYGNSLGNQAVPFAILSVTIIFSAQSLLLITTLQAVGKTASILGVSLAAVAIDLATIGVGATALGTTAGALGRALLAGATMVLAWAALRRVLHAPVSQGLSKAVALTVSSAGPLFIADYLLTSRLGIAPLSRIPILVVVFASCYVGASRLLSVFERTDFDLLETAIPSSFRSLLARLEQLLVPDRHQL